MPNRRILVQRDVVLPRAVVPREWRLLVIAVEGERREYNYFSHIRSKMCTSRVKVQLLPTSYGHSQPESLLQRLQTARAESDLQSEDECWLVFDVDDRDDARMQLICAEANKERFRVAISNPCFELWLFLHRFNALELSDNIQQVRIEQRPQAMKAILDQKMDGYTYHSLPVGTLLEEVKSAIRRAKLGQRNSRRTYPAFPGTDVYLVIESMLEHMSSAP